jgi:uncharacterized protein
MEPDNSSTNLTPAPLPVFTAVPPKHGNFFYGHHGLRAGWRLLIYFVIVIGASALLSAIARQLHGATRGTPPPGLLMFSEVANFFVVFGAAWVMSRIEKRPMGAYGLPARDAFRKKFWLGILFGLLEICALVGLIRMFGGYSFGSFALHGTDILRWAGYYGIFFLFVGFFEEFAFRGYTQFTLADGIGFWPAAIVLSALFGGVHLFNPGEGLVGGLGVFVVAMLFAFTLRRTGNLWYAVGLHGAFDWGETFLFSVPDSGFVFPGHLSNSLLHGPKWLTGGTVGPEGSLFCFLTMALQFLVVMWLFPSKRDPQPQATAYVTPPADASSDAVTP